MSNYSKIPCVAPTTESAPGEVLEIAGALTIATAAQWRSTLQEWMSRHPVGKVDLGPVTVCDTAGLQLICSLLKTTSHDGQWPQLVQVSGAVCRAAQNIGLEDFHFLPVDTPES